MRSEPGGRCRDARILRPTLTEELNVAEATDLAQAFGAREVAMLDPVTPSSWELAALERRGARGFAVECKA